MKLILVLVFLPLFLFVSLPSSDPPILISSISKNPEKPNIISLNTFTYEKNGNDWPGSCLSGSHQSPINIIESINTQSDEKNSLSFFYKMERDFASTYEKFIYDGRTLEAKAAIGNLVFNHEDGTIETFKSNKIVVHYPAEHCITVDGKTPRYPLEIQIEHFLTETTNDKTTNYFINVRKAIVSILFKEASEKMQEGDQFLSFMGIDERLKRPDATFRTIDIGEKIDSDESSQGKIRPGFSLDAFLGLKEILNLDHHIYRYYGSETQPPCSENVEWFVFASPRTVSKLQLEFLKAQIAKKKSKQENELDIIGLFGNNRNLQAYDDSSSGKIFSMKNGVSYIEKLEFSKS